MRITRAPIRRKRIPLLRWRQNKAYRAAASHFFYDKTAKQKSHCPHCFLHLCIPGELFSIFAVPSPSKTVFRREETV